jgi:hypothetical protein
MTKHFDGARIVCVIEPTERVKAVAVEWARHFRRNRATTDRAQPRERDVLQLQMSFRFWHGALARGLILLRPDECCCVESSMKTPPRKSMRGGRDVRFVGEAQRDSRVSGV